MIYKEIKCKDINTFEKFHDVFRREFKFPYYYGENMDAWIDCMSDINDSVCIYLNGVKEIKGSEIYNQLIECTAFINYRHGRKYPKIALAFHEDDYVNENFEW